MIFDNHPSSFEGVVQLIIQHERSFARVVEEGVHLLVEECRPMLDAGITSSLRHRRVERVVLRRSTEQRQVGPAKASYALVVEDNLAHRKKSDFRTLRSRALRERIEGANAFERISEEIQAQGFVGAWDEEVDDAAANSILTGLSNRRRSLESVVGEPTREVVHVDRTAHLRDTSACPKNGRRQ